MNYFEEEKKKKTVVFMLQVSAFVYFYGLFNLGFPSPFNAGQSFEQASPHACAPDVSVRLSRHYEFGRGGDAQPIGLREY